MAAPTTSVSRRAQRLVDAEAAGGRVCPRCEEFRDKEQYAATAWGLTAGSWMCRPCKATDNRARKYRLRYGLELEEYDHMLEEQAGGCALCGGDSPGQRFQVDHCHDTGRVRGLLCVRCNGGLGALGDNEEGLLAALAYVRGDRHG